MEVTVVTEARESSSLAGESFRKRLQGLPPEELARIAEELREYEERAHRHLEESFRLAAEPGEFDGFSQNFIREIMPNLRLKQRAVAEEINRRPV